MLNKLNLNHSIIFLIFCLVLVSLDYFRLNTLLYTCLFLVLTIGISHGSLDNLKGKKLLQWYNRYEYRINNFFEWSTCNYFYPFKYSLIFYYCELRKKFIRTCSCPRSDGYFGIKLLFTTTSCIHTLFLFLAFNKAFNIFDVWVRQ